MDLNSIIVWVVVGGVAGTVADWLVRGVRMGCLGTVIIGIIGAFVGGWLLGTLGISIGGGLINDIVTASIGAIVVLLGIRLLRRA